MSSLFDLFSLFYVLVGLRTVGTLIKNWRAFADDTLTGFDRRLASELAFFLFIPVGVLLHELGHAAATYQVGGTIDWLGGGFHYALFWGYVVPEGRFTALQDWWIALSGNLVSVIYGFLPLIALRWANKAWLKYTLLAFARIQLGWSLVGYPLISLLAVVAPIGFDGDWSTIYSARTLLVSAPLLVVHVALVAALWTADRSRRVKRWEIGLYAGGEQLGVLDQVVAARPGTVDPLVARGNYFAALGQVDLALADYRAALKLDPQNPRVLYNVGQIRLMQKNTAEAGKNFRAALVRAGGDPPTAARVHYGLALSLFERGRAKEAVGEFNQAVQYVSDVPEFYYWRGLALRQTHDAAAARNDFTRAAEMAALSNPALAQQARQMLAST